MRDDISDESWREYRKLILKQLEDLTDAVKETQEEVSSMRSEISMLKVKSGVWGALGAAVPILIAMVIWLLTKKP